MPPQRLRLLLVLLSLSITALAGGTLALLAIAKKSKSEPPQSPPDLMGDGPFVDGTFQSRPAWFLKTVNRQTGETVTELRAWRFSDGELSCVIFIQDVNGAKFPTSSCWPSWLL